MAIANQAPNPIESQQFIGAERRSRRFHWGVVAEGEGFEPSIRFFTVYTLSRRAPSTTRPSLPGAEHHSDEARALQGGRVRKITLRRRGAGRPGLSARRPAQASPKGRLHPPQFPASMLSAVLAFPVQPEQVAGMLVAMPTLVLDPVPIVGAGLDGRREQQAAGQHHSHHQCAH